MPTNQNYRETKDGYMRDENAPDAQHKSRINWGRLQAIQDLRQSITDARQKQNERNEEYKRSHGS